MFRELRLGAIMPPPGTNDTHHWYLMVIGVDPMYQGRGYASALIKPTLAQIDREHLPCYLETNNERNVPIFEHYGFKVVEAGIIPGTNVSHWAMLRETPVN